MTELLKSDGLCKSEVKTTQKHRVKIPDIVDQLVLSCHQEDCFNHVGQGPLPSREAVVDLINRACRLLFPGYFIRQRLDEINLNYYFGQEAVAFFEALAGQLTLCIRHECLRYDQDCTHCEERGQEEAIRFIRELPGLRTMLARDVRAAYDGDPAAKSFDEIIFSYPGLFAVTVYRIAHQILIQGLPLMPRIMTEHAHSLLCHCPRHGQT
jgi:serine O-acetyltransferase